MLFVALLSAAPGSHAALLGSNGPCFRTGLAVAVRCCKHTAVTAACLAALTTASPASAFENSLPLPPSSSAPLPRKPGPAPVDLGIQKETGALKPCLDTKPHCFSTAKIVDYDEFAYDQAVGDTGYIQPWTFSKPRDEAMADVMRAVREYPPGQSGVDGGGWKIVREEPSYVYVQYESLLKGFKDDVEFAILGDDGALSMRSSSRIGRQDYLVNAKRLNWYADRLGATAGWKTTPISEQTHAVYWRENTVPQGRAADMRAAREGSTP